MKFKIVEDVLDAWKVYKGMIYLYKNPTPQEMRSKGDSTDNRGVIDSKTGDLYMEATWSGEEGENWSSYIHNSLIDVLHEKGVLKNFDSAKWFFNPDCLKWGLCVQRLNNTMDFYIAESYQPNMRNNANLIKAIEKIMVKAKLKNPHLNFYPKNILNVKWGD